MAGPETVAYEERHSLLFNIRVIKWRRKTGGACSTHRVYAELTLEGGIKTSINMKLYLFGLG